MLGTHEGEAGVVVGSGDEVEGGALVVEAVVEALATAVGGLPAPLTAMLRATKGRRRDRQISKTKSSGGETTSKRQSTSARAPTTSTSGSRLRQCAILPLCPSRAQEPAILQAT